MISRYDFFAFLKKHRAYTAWINGIRRKHGFLDDDRAMADINKWLTLERFNGWVVLAFTWSIQPIGKYKTENDRSDAWSRVHAKWNIRVTAINKANEKNKQ